MFLRGEMMAKAKVKKGQTWRSKDSGIMVTIINKATGNGHWNVKTDRKKCHHMSSWTLIRYYELIK